MKNEFTPHERRLASAILRARRAPFIGLTYVDADGVETERVVQIGIDIAKAHAKQSGFTGTGSWTTKARHIGHRNQIVINKEGRPSLRAKCKLRGWDMRIFRLDGIKSARGLQFCE